MSFPVLLFGEIRDMGKHGDVILIMKTRVSQDSHSGALGSRIEAL